VRWDKKEKRKKREGEKLHIQTAKKMPFEVTADREVS